MVLPIGDINPAHRTALIMGAIALINLGVFVLLQAPLTGCEQQLFVYRWAAIPREITTWQPLSSGELEQLMGSCAASVPDKSIGLSLVTSMFLHGGLGHLLGNLIYLVVFGNNVEDRLGHLRFVLFYLLGGAVATLAYAVVRPASLTPLVGASGGIAAILGAYLICYPRARVLALVPFPLYLVAVVLPGIRIRSWWVIVAVVTMPAWLLLGGWFVLQWTSARSPVGDAIAYEAHVGGFLAGIVLVLVLDAWRRRHGEQPFHPTRPQTPRR
ncbi:MAG: rhomboid family intramembrane serine protease [Actinomycetota bacterium]